MPQSSFRRLRVAAVLLGLGTLSACADMPEPLSLFSADRTSQAEQTTATADAATRAPSSAPMPEDTADKALHLARLLRDNGRMTAAYEIYERLDRRGALGPQQSLEYATIAGVVLAPQAAQSLFVQARERLGGEAALTPAEHLVISLGLGRGRLSMGLLDDAARDFSSALEIDADNLDALNGLGVTRGAQGDTQAAEALFRQALDRDPSNAAALNNLALTRIQAGDIGGAVALLGNDNARRTPTIALNLALAHLLRNDEAAARRTLTRHLPDVDVDHLLRPLRQSARRITDGHAPEGEFLAASRTALALDVRQ